MALNRTLLQMRGSLQKLADIEGTTALQRHPEADLNDYLNRGLGALHRILTQALPDQRLLSSTTVTTSAGTTTYALPATFDHLISVDIVANGAKSWLVAYEMHERPALTDATATFSGIPFTYRLRGSNIELLPTPGSAYVATLWYVPTPTQFAASGDDAVTVDTINRLDDFVIAYGARYVAIKDKNWDLVQACKGIMEELREEIEVIARSRDKNSPSRIVDECHANRWGRRAPLPRGWR